MQVPLFDLSRQHQEIKQEVLEKWTECIDKNAFTHGEETEQFEKNFASLCGVKYALGVRSGTASLIIALKTLSLQPGDEVITTPTTFSATADAIILAGGTPVLVDVDELTGNIDPKEIEKHVTRKTKAVLIVHLYGVPCQMDEIVSLCKKKSLTLIEDASHAHGSLYKRKPVGSFGKYGCFSLYPSKTLGAMGNAGVITANSVREYQSLRMYANHGIKRFSEKYTHYVSGYNELIDTTQSAVLNIKLKKLPKWIKRKREIADYYNSIFKHFDHFGMVWSDDVDPSLYVYAVQVKRRRHFQTHMEKNGVQTGIYYPTTLHLQPSMKFLGYTKGSFPKAEKFFQQTLSLPLFPELTDSEVEYIGDVISSYFSQ